MKHLKKLLNTLILKYKLYLRHLIEVLNRKYLIMF